LVELMKAKRTDFRQDLPLYIGEEFFVGTYSKRPNGQIQTLSVVPRQDIEALGLVKIVEGKTRRPSCRGPTSPSCRAGDRL